MVNRNSVEEIRIQVDKDVAAGLYDEETGKEVIAEAIRLEDTTEPTVSRMLTPEPTPAPEPTLTAPITDDFDVIPTEAEIVQRVAEQRRDTAEVNLASHFEFDRDGFQITGVRMDEAIEAGARPQDLIAMGIEQAAIDETIERVAERQALEQEQVLESFLPPIPPSSVPRPTVQPAALPDLPSVPPDLKRIQQEAINRQRVMQLSIAETGGYSPTITTLVTREALVDETVRAVESGDISAAQARNTIDNLRELPLPGTIREMGYIVPGLGTVLSYQDWRNSPNPASLAFFIGSAALDMVTVVVPVARGLGVGRGYISVPKVNLTELPITRLIKAQTAEAQGVLTEAQLARLRSELTVTSRPIGNRGIRLTVDEIDPALPESRTFTLERLNAKGEVVDDLFVFMEKDGKNVKADVVRRPQFDELGEEITDIVTRPEDFMGTVGEVRDILRTVKTMFPEAETATGFRTTAGRTVEREAIFKLPSIDTFATRVATLKPTTFFSGTATPTRPKPAPVIAPVKPRPVRTDPGPRRTEPVPRTRPIPKPDLPEGPPTPTPTPTTRPKPVPIPTPKPGTDEPLPEPAPLEPAVSPFRIPTPEAPATPEPAKEPVTEPIQEPAPDTEPAPDPTPTPDTQPEFEEPTPTETPGLEPTTAPDAKPEPTTAPDTAPDTEPVTEPDTAPDTAPVTAPDTAPGGGKTQPQPAPTSGLQTKPEPGGGKTQPQPAPKTLITKTPPGKPPGTPKVMPRFELPSGKKLPSGVYAKIVTWGQGETKVTANLQTGEIIWGDRVPDGRSPRQTFRVVETTTDIPRRRSFRMGFEDVDYSIRGITFKQNKISKKNPLRKRRGKI